MFNTNITIIDSTLMYLPTGHTEYIFLKPVWNFEGEDVRGWFMVALRPEAMRRHRIWDLNTLNV